MEQELGQQTQTIDAISYDKLLSISNILKDSIKFGKYCCLREITTDTDRDIFKYPVRIDAYILVICSSGVIDLTYNLRHIRLYRILYEQNEQYDRETGSALLAIQENSHFDRFMRLLQENYKRCHNIQFYADRMGLTPKYLSLMIKKVSGRLATEWIDDYVILEAKNLIKYSSMSIQEISYALNFPNQSFFGKYFKRHTGLSPKEYRRQP